MQTGHCRYTAPPAFNAPQEAIVARKFDNWLKAYIQYTLDSEAPDDFHFWSGVSTLAGALRARVWIDMRKFRWTPNFYTILVGPPGIVTKSTSIRAGMRLLERVQDIQFGPPSMTWQALTESLEAAIFHMPMPGEEGKFLPMSCLTVPVSELGTFLKMEDKGLVEVLIDLWDGQLGTWGHRTKTQGKIEIKNPWINLIACTTPSWLKDNFPESVVGGGLVSRILFVYGDRKRKLIPYPDEVIPDREYHALEEDLTHDLQEIASLSGPYLLDSDARAWGREWYERHWAGARPAHLSSERYSGYLSRKQTHMHKLAIVLAAARSDELVLRPEHLIEAEALLETVEPHMLKVFESIGVVDEAKNIRELQSHVKIHGFLTSDELFKLVMNVMSQKDFIEALQAAVRGGLFNITTRDGRKGVVLSTIH